MLFRNSPDRFGLVTKLFHWLIAALIIFLIWLGWYMVDLTYFDRWYNESLEWHKSLGMLVFGLAVLKIGWQAYSPTPQNPAPLKPWERTAAAVMHFTLLAVMALLPVTGYLISTSAGKGVAVFGLFEIPPLVKGDETLRDLAIEVHFYLAYGTALLLIGHAGAALKHEFLNRDGTLKRMLWG
ncbi:MAG: cytochrome b [Gammaproteobacteria bacterium]|nr:cytochrome b [Gammaproteobacteria bacterium]